MSPKNSKIKTLILLTGITCILVFGFLVLQKLIKNGTDEKQILGESYSEIQVESKILSIDTLNEGYRVNFQFILENLNNIGIEDLKVEINLEKSMGNTGYDVASLRSDSLQTNKNFDGTNNLSLVASGQELKANSKSDIELSLVITPSEDGTPYDIYIEAEGNLVGDKESDENNSLDQNSDETANSNDQVNESSNVESNQEEVPAENQSNQANNQNDVVGEEKNNTPPKVENEDKGNNGNHYGGGNGNANNDNNSNGQGNGNGSKNNKGNKGGKKNNQSADQVDTIVDNTDNVVEVEPETDAQPEADQTNVNAEDNTNTVDEIQPETNIVVEDSVDSTQNSTSEESESQSDVVPSVSGSGFLSFSFIFEPGSTDIVEQEDQVDESSDTTNDVDVIETPTEEVDNDVVVQIVTRDPETRSNITSIVVVDKAPNLVTRVASDNLGSKRQINTQFVGITASSANGSPAELENTSGGINPYWLAISPVLLAGTILFVRNIKNENRY